MPSVAVIGAGAVGACIALELQRRGARVTLIDRNAPGTGCSQGNSGAISANSVVPLATPGVLASLPGMLCDRQRPVYLPWRYLPHALPWLARFVSTATKAKVAKSISRLASLHAGAVEKHKRLATEVGVPELFLQRGHLHLYPNKQSYQKDAEAWRIRAELGFPHQLLDRDGVVSLEPRIGPRYLVGAFLSDQGTILNPMRYVQAIAGAFAANGGVVLQAEVNALHSIEGGAWSLRFRSAEMHFTHVVVAAGVWSRRLLDPLKVRLRLESQRGYHVQFQKDSDAVSRTVVFTDYKVFITPMENGLRVGGTVEFAGLHAPEDWRRAALLERIARENLYGLHDPPSSRWAGHRPCLPDSVPFIGAAAGHPGLWLAVGHGHLGLTESPVTGERIADAIFKHEAERNTA